MPPSLDGEAAADPIRLWCTPAGTEQPRPLRYRYSIAGLDLHSNYALPELARRAELTDRSADQAPQPPSFLSVDRTPPDYAEAAWVGGQTLQLEAWWQGNRCQLRVANGTACAVDLETGSLWSCSESDAAWRDSVASKPTPSWLQRWLLGPPMLLQLAWRGIYALHASAVAIQGRWVAFVAESGIGKSTMAATPCHHWQRLADDLLPVRVQQDERQQDEVWALGGYPQPKLPRENRLPLGPGCDGRLTALILLQPSAPQSEPKIERLSPLEATTTWLRHTMVARLFHPPLLQRHLDFAALAVSRVRTLRVLVPRDLQRLSEVQALVSEAVLGETAQGQLAPGGGAGLGGTE